MKDRTSSSGSGGRVAAADELAKCRGELAHTTTELEATRLELQQWIAAATKHSAGSER